MTGKPTLAFFGPLLPLKSGVAEYSTSLVKELAKAFRVQAYIDDGYTPDGLENSDVTINASSQFKGAEDIALFQPSNGPLHAYMYPLLLKYGGVSTLHDATLFDMVMIHWEGKPRAAFWLDFIRNEGLTGVMKLLSREPGDPINPSELILKNLYKDELNKRERFRFLKRVAKSSKALITHSKYVAEAALSINPDLPVLETMLGVEDRNIQRSKTESRDYLNLAKHGIKPDSFVLISYGHIQSHKRIPQCLEAFAKLTRSNPDARYILLGPRSPSVNVEELAEKFNVLNKVMVVDNYPPLEEVNEYLNSADLCLNLRWPAFGSNSYSLVQSLAAGVPTAVTDIETFGEYPDDAVIKVKWDEKDEVENIYKTLEWAQQNPKELEAFGEAGKEFVKLNCTWEVVGKQYTKFLQSNM